MPVTATHLTTNGDANNLSTYVTASITPSANKLILVWVGNVSTSGDQTPTLTGNGLTWVQVASVNGFPAAAARITLFRAMGASPSTGAVTIDFGGTAQHRCLWSICEFGNVDTGGTNGSAAVVQSVTNLALAATSLTVTLGAFGSTGNATAGGFYTRGNGSADLVPGSGFTQLGEVVQVDTSEGMLSEWRNDNDTSVDASWGNLEDIGGIAVEIKFSPGLVLYASNPIQSGSNSGLLTPTVPTASTSTTGWIQGTQLTGVYSRVSYNNERAEATFTSTAQPSGSPLGSAQDCWRISAATTGDFSAGTWYSSLSVIAVTSGGFQDGRARFRIWRSANADGTSATEVTAGTMIGSLVTNLNVTTAQSSSASTQIAAFSMANQYLFMQAAWESTST